MNFKRVHNHTKITQPILGGLSDSLISDLERPLSLIGDARATFVISMSLESSILNYYKVSFILVNYCI